MTRKFKCFLILLLLCIYGSTISAQMEGIITDRPDQTESSAIVPGGWIQAEHGFGVNFQDFSTEYSIASTLLRYGINQYFELRLVVDPVFTSEPENKFVLLPLSLGLKSKLISNQFMDMALITHIQFAKLATIDYETLYTAMASRLTVSHDLKDWWGIGYNLGLEWDGMSAAPYYIYTFTSGFGIGEHFGAFAEVFGNIYNSNQNDQIGGPLDEHYFDAGFTFSPNDNLQFDIAGGSILQQGVKNIFITTGISYRFNIIKN